MRKLTCLALGALGALCLVVAGARAAAPTVIGTLDDLTSLNAHVVTATATCPAGNVLAVFTENGANNSTIADSQGGTWTSSNYVSQAGLGRYRQHYRVLAADFVSGVDSITINQSTASTVQVVAVCFDGTTAEQSATVTSPTVSASTQGVQTAAASAVPQYVVAAVGVNNGGDDLVDTSSPAWTELAKVGSARAILVSYKRVTVAGTVELFSTATGGISAWGAGYVAVPEAGDGEPDIAPQSPLLTLGVGG